MIVRKFIALGTALLGLGAFASLEATPALSVVNFSSCITDSKYGKKEQENFENIRKQLGSLIENTEKEMRDLSSKFEDTEYLDSLSPKAEEEMKGRYQALNEDLARYQNQFYHIMQQANMQMLNKMNAQIARAAEKLAQENNLDYIVNREACFYFRPDLDLTNQIIVEMDKNFEIELKEKAVSDNAEAAPVQSDEVPSEAIAG